LFVLAVKLDQYLWCRFDHFCWAGGGGGGDDDSADFGGGFTFFFVCVKRIILAKGY
jgi:hypothetical protein